VAKEIKARRVFGEFELDEGSLYINTKWILMKKEQGRRKRQES
jgi:hypothetical protein